MLRLVDRGLMVISWVAAALVVVLLFAGPSLVGAKKSAAPTTSATPATSTTGHGSKAGSSAQVSGAAVFASAGCSGCHTLKAAHATGGVGPNLDQVQPSATQVSQIVQSGGGGMPSFSGKLSDAEIAAVASYVSTVAGH
jgi:cytochrome c6